jgi:hypothetical protein
MTQTNLKYFTLATVAISTVLIGCSRERSGASRAFARELSLEPTRTIEFTTSVGSGMSVNESPDGQTIMLVGPNVHVSRDNDVPYNETHVAAHPSDENVLIGAGIVMDALDTPGDDRQKVYISRDRGNSWTASYIDLERRYIRRNTVDPFVGFGATGTIFAHFTDQPLLRSTDGGKTWTGSTRKDLAGTFWNADRETFVVDMSKSRFHGRVYLITNDAGSDSKYNRVLLRSSDDGRTFDSARGIDPNRDYFGSHSQYPSVLSDGTLIMPTGERTPGPREYKGVYRWVINLSTDGGETFKRQGVLPEFRDVPANATTCSPVGKSVVNSGGGQRFAADVNPRSKFRDRLYAAWPDCRSGAWRVYFTSSIDRGATWSAPRALSMDVPASSSQFVAAIAVSPTGAVGVQWYDTRNSEQSEGYDLYFTASTDGGATFAPAVRVTSEISKPSAPTLARQVIRARTREELGQDAPREFRIFRGNIDETRGTGHYAGLVADAGGVFHPFWTDARNGNSQIYTAQVRVVSDAGSSQNAPADPCDAGTEKSLRNLVDLEFDAPHFDSLNNEVQLPVRLRNLSADTVCGPFNVSLMLVDAKALMDMRQNGAKLEFKPSETKEYRLREALKDLPYLSPGATTEPLVWRIHFDANRQTPSVTGRMFHYEVRGRSARIK